MLVLLALVLLGEAGKALETGRIEGRGRLGLEGTTDQQVGGEERSEVHVKGGARRLLGRGGHGGQTTGVDRGDVGAVPVRVARNRGLVGGEGAVREAQVVAVHSQSREGVRWPVELGRLCSGFRHLHCLIKGGLKRCMLLGIQIERVYVQLERRLKLSSS